MKSRVKALLWVFLLWSLGGTSSAQSARGGPLKDPGTLLGPRDAVILVDSAGRMLIEKNAAQPLVPASILKILTSLVAIHHLGLDYRFVTEFYLDEKNDLIIKGYGDPLLISETVAAIAARLAEAITEIKDIVVDDSHFVQPLEIPGVSSSSRPYDAPNGALCVNFNTVYFKNKNGVFVSAEPQTPLLPVAVQRVRSSGLSKGRIVLSHDENHVTLYAGGLFEHFLREAGVKISGAVRPGFVHPGKDRPVHRHVSSFTLRDIIAKLLDHSNNFTANQILIAAGAKAFGPPGNLDKGVTAAHAFARNRLDLKHTRIREGSGISRDNRVSAEDMGKVLDAFFPHRALLRNEGREFYKTGTLRGVSTRAGYVERSDSDFHRFVVIINNPGKSADQVARRLLGGLD